MPQVLSSRSPSPFRNLRAHFFDQVFLLCHKTIILLEIAVFEALCAIGFSILGTYFFGLTGAAAGVLCATLIGLTISAKLSMRRYNLRFPTKELIRISFATLVMVGVLLTLPPAVNWSELIFKIFVGGFINIVVMSLLYLTTIIRKFSPLTGI